MPLSPGGTGGADGAIHLCDLRKKEPERIAFQHKSTVVRALQFDDSCLVVGTETGAIRVLDLSSGAYANTPIPPLASWHLSNALTSQPEPDTWPFPGRCMQILAGEHARSVSSVQFDERRIVSGSPDWSVRVWDRVTGQCVEELEEHMRGVFAVRFDRQKLVSGGGDRLVKVWDWDDDLWCINTLRGHTGPVLSVDCDDVRLVSEPPTTPCGCGTLAILTTCVDRLRLAASTPSCPWLHSPAPRPTRTVSSSRRTSSSSSIGGVKIAQGWSVQCKETKMKMTVYENP
jgi:hypothetical protein